MRKLGEHKKLGGDRTRIADPNCKKGYPIPYGVMQINKTVGLLLGRGLGTDEWWGALALCITCFAYSVIIIITIPFLFCSIKPSLSQPMGFYILFIYLCIYSLLDSLLYPIVERCGVSKHLKGGASKQLCGTCLPAGLNHNRS